MYGGAVISGGPVDFFGSPSLVARDTKAMLASSAFGSGGVREKERRANKQRCKGHLRFFLKATYRALYLADSH
jgi:hypothetical protein